MHNSNKGFSIAIIVVVIIAATIGGIIGYKLLTISSKQPAKTNQVQQNSNTETKKASPVVKDNSDLTNLESSLESEDIEGSQKSQLDSEFNF